MPDRSCPKWERPHPHSAHNGKTPIERYFELAEQTPYDDVVQTNYQLNEEHIQEQNYRLERALRKLKR
ncbi:transposase [Erwinia sp. OAMSP11]|nr:transposase [Erwinia sp. OAMSP11]